MVERPGGTEGGWEGVSGIIDRLLFQRGPLGLRARRPGEEREQG